MSARIVEDRDPAELLALARDVALEAAALVAERRRDSVSVAATKSSEVDVVTEADRAAEALIADRLLAARPADGLVGEEGTGSSSASGVTWVVDPIDGTVNFLYDIPQYAVSIAARLDGGDAGSAGTDAVVAGVVVDVAKGECFTATRGGGAWLGERRLRVREVAPMGQRLVATGFNYEQDIRLLQGRAVASLLPHVRDIRRLGSAALDLCGLAAGRLDAYVEEGLAEWDLAAGGLIAQEAGARVAVGTGAGGKTCVVAAPEDGFDEFDALVRTCGFLRD
ncbi:MAG: inositol monophosphatase family protein [Actinomycetes bacterium]